MVLFDELLLDFAFRLLKWPAPTVINKPQINSNKTGKNFRVMFALLRLKLDFEY